jgi:hypothetical protein
VLFETNIFADGKEQLEPITIIEIKLYREEGTRPDVTNNAMLKQIPAVAFKTLQLRRKTAPVVMPPKTP